MPFASSLTVQPAAHEQTRRRAIDSSGKGDAPVVAPPSAATMTSPACAAILRGERRGAQQQSSRSASRRCVIATRMADCGRTRGFPARRHSAAGSMGLAYNTRHTTRAAKVRDLRPCFPQQFAPPAMAHACRLRAGWPAVLHAWLRFTRHDGRGAGTHLSSRAPSPVDWPSNAGTVCAVLAGCCRCWPATEIRRRPVAGQAGSALASAPSTAHSSPAGSPRLRLRIAWMA